MDDKELYIGAMSGTSCDGIDVVLIDLKQPPFQILASFSKAYEPSLQQTLTELAAATTYDINKLYTIDAQIGHYYAEAINSLLATLSEQTRKSVLAIGMHGQTIRHCPNAAIPFTVQLGCASTVAAKTNLPVIADFRRKDIVKGGQGAPLAPLFHQQAFCRPRETVAVVNIGGISNISLLANHELIAGFDIGPGNIIIDSLSKKYFNRAYDDGGKLAAQGSVIPQWLNSCLSDPYFAKAAPKSTGREHFNLDWFMGYQPKSEQSDPLNMLATATELTAQTIANTVNATKLTNVYICGGGAYNHFLLQRISGLTAHPVATTQAAGVAPEHVEAATFAWLAQQTWQRQALDLSKVTGSTGTACLGGVYWP